MTDSNVLDLKTPAQDPLNELLKQGAQQLLGKAIEAELAELLAQWRPTGQRAQSVAPLRQRHQVQ